MDVFLGLLLCKSSHFVNLRIVIDRRNNHINNLLISCYFTLGNGPEGSETRIRRAPCHSLKIC